MPQGLISRYERQRRVYYERKASGLCTHCPTHKQAKAENGILLCSKCFETRARAREEKRRENEKSS